MNHPRIRIITQNHYLEDMQIQPNKVVSLTYELRVDDENGEQTLVEKVERDQPLVFLYGAGSMLEEFERHLNGLKEGDAFDFPGGGVIVQRELGLETVGALDVRNQCSGFLYALSVADQFIKGGMYRTVLVIGSEIQSSLLDLSDAGRAMAVIFGDGAGAVVLQATEDPAHRILSTHLHADGRHAEELMVKDPGSSRAGRWITKETVEAGGTEPYMNGQAVFKQAVIRFPEVIREALEKNGYAPQDIDLLVPHQANLRISTHVQETLGLAPEKVVNNIQRYGNTTAASIPIALSEAWEAGRVQPGHLVCLAAFGSGFTWASALIRW